MPSENDGTEETNDDAGNERELDRGSRDPGECCRLFKVPFARLEQPTALLDGTRFRHGFQCNSRVEVVHRFSGVDHRENRRFPNSTPNATNG